MPYSEVVDTGPVGLLLLTNLPIELFVLPELEAMHKSFLCIGGPGAKAWAKEQYNNTSKRAAVQALTSNDERR